MTKSVLPLLSVFMLFLSSCVTTKTGPSAKSTPTAGDFNYYFEQGTQSLKENAYKRAVEQFDKAIFLNPKSEKAHNLRGIAYLNLKNYAAAEEEFQKAVSLNPIYSEAYNNLGGVYFLKNQLEVAEAMFKKALALDPDLISANYSLGTLLLIKGKRGEGAQYLARGIELDPDYLETHRTLSASVTSSVSDVSELYYTFAKIYAAKGNVDKTLEFLQKARTAGFRDWSRVFVEKEFEKVLGDPRLKEFLQEK
jgi:Tfp pilus assembly protein PilF